MLQKLLAKLATMQTTISYRVLGKSMQIAALDGHNVAAHYEEQLKDVETIEDWLRLRGWSKRSRDWVRGECTYTLIEAVNLEIEAHCDADSIS